MPQPKADPARCDVFGCGLIATNMTDGSEADKRKLGRKAMPFINHCGRHEDWPFSEDAQRFAQQDNNYRNRK